MDEAQEAEGLTGNFRHIFRTLKYRNYRLFFTGQSISLIGTWLQMIAVSWLVYRLTGSYMMLGLVGFVSRIPTFVVAPFAGVLADRANKHKIIIITQVLSLLQAAAFAFLIFTGTIQIWHIIVLGVILGIINSFDIPVRQSFVVQMVEDKKDLGNAIALNSSMVNGARLIGPTIAGLLIAAVGEFWCFSLNALSFIAVIAGLLMMRLKPLPVKPKPGSHFKTLKEGFKYASRHPQISSLLLLLAFVNLLGMPYQTLLPGFSDKVFQGTSELFGISIASVKYGLLMGSAGLGALLGALYLAGRKKQEGLAKVIVISTFIFGAGLILFSLTRTLLLALPMLVVCGFGMMVLMAGTNTLLQQVVEEDKRGRVMSFYTMAFMGMQPFGSLLSGWLAKMYGGPASVLIGGIASIFAALYFGRRLLRSSETKF